MSGHFREARWANSTARTRLDLDIEAESTEALWIGDLKHCQVTYQIETESGTYAANELQLQSSIDPDIGWHKVIDIKAVGIGSVQSTAIPGTYVRLYSTGAGSAVVTARIHAREI